MMESEMTVDNDTIIDNEYGQFVDLETLDIYLDKNKEQLNNYNNKIRNNFIKVGYVVYTIHAVWWIGITYIIYIVIFR